MNPRFVGLDRVGIKICGLTTLENALEVAALGADALGFNFWPKSKRYIAPSEFAWWARDLPEEIDRVGVFVNAEAGQVFELLESGAIHAAQFHGDESAGYCEAFAGRFPFLRAIRVRSAESLKDATQFGAETLLLDAYCPGELGGSGEQFDWELGRRFVADNPQLRVVLAGGLTPQNVARAAAGVQPAAVDVASGVESAPGVKDLSLVEAFIEAVRNGAL